ncbi:MAG: hypothetical protein PVSMB7_26380 [Chloroflexota bacterium]
MQQFPGTRADQVGTKHFAPSKGVAQDRLLSHDDFDETLRLMCDDRSIDGGVRQLDHLNVVAVPLAGFHLGEAHVGDLWIGKDDPRYNAIVGLAPFTRRIFGGNSPW